MKIRNTLVFCAVILTSGTIVVQALANPDNLIPIWGATPVLETEAHETEVINSVPVICSLYSARDRDQRIHLVAQAKEDCIRVGGTVN